MSEKPTGVTANKSKKEFTITWDDGHTSIYPFGLLRAACPCAQCRGGHQNMKSEPDEFSIDDLKRKKSEPWSGVRNYQARN